MRLPLCLVSLLAACLAPAGPAKPPANVGRKVDNVRLAGAGGKAVGQHDLAGKEAVVVVFLSFECPVSTGYLPALGNLARAYGPRNVAFLGVCPTDGAKALAARAKEFSVAFPLFPDDGLAAARAFQARTVPEAFVLDRGFVLRYRGRVDDAYYARSRKRQVTTRHDLREALDDVLAGRPVRTPVTEAVGCAIRYERPRATSTSVTYHRDVLPILQANCQQCHRPGEVGRFALMNYRQALNWAPDIKAYTQSRTMPPWKPTEGVSFVGERKLTQKEIDTLAAWVDAGAPEGDPKDAPPPRRFTDGWQLGPPDLVLEPKEEMTVGADGPDLFRCFVLPTSLPEDQFVIAYEVRPGNPRVVHHTVHFLDTKGRGRRLEQRERERPKAPGEKDRGPGYNCRMLPGFWPSGDVGGWAPGLRPHTFTGGFGYYLPKGADVVVQVHYHRTGRVEKDRTRIGLHFAKKPCKALQGVPVPARFLWVPAGAADYKVKGDVWLATDCTVHSVMPHMHLLGKSIRVSATPPGGKTVTLVGIKEWDYNWQEMYFLKQPLKLKAGTRLTVEGAYDNSDKNPNNPNSPPKLVTIGEQTTNEMCFGFLGVTTEDGGPFGVRFTPGGPVIHRPGVLPQVVSRTSPKR